MTLIITDIPLEDHFEHIPPIKSPVIDETISINGKAVQTRSDLLNPHFYRERLKYGPLVVQRWFQSVVPGPDTAPGKINRLLLETGKEWFSYLVDNKCSHSDMELMLFVYRYLTDIGDRICIYRQFNLEYLGPETPVARIDVSDKPLSDTILRSIQNDVLHVFSDNRGSSASHDTGILERMGEDPKDDRFNSFYAPCDTMTLSELRRILGNCYSIINVYDQLEVETAAEQLRFKEWRESYQDYARPVEIVARTQEFADRTIDDGYPEPISVGSSHYDACPVKLYKFNGSNHELGCRQTKIRSDCTLGGTMDVIAVVDRGNRRRPIPEILFRRIQSFERDGVRTHRLYLRTSPDAVFGEFYRPVESKESLSVTVELVMYPGYGPPTALKVELSMGSDFNHSWNLMKRENGNMDLWCIDFMGSDTDPTLEHDEQECIKFILKNAEGVQDEGIGKELDYIIPLIAVRKVLSRAITHLDSLEPDLRPYILEAFGNCDRESVMGHLSDIAERIEIDIKGFVLHQGDGDGKFKLRLAKHFGGKG